MQISMQRIKSMSLFVKSNQWVNLYRCMLTALIVTFSHCAVADNFRLFIGQMKTLPFSEIDRVAVGNGSLVSTSIMDNGELLVLAEKAGDTEIQIWLKSGQSVTHKFYIIPANTARSVSELRSIIGRVKGLKVTQVGSNIILKGAISHKASQMIKKVTKVYNNVLDLTSATASSDLSKVFKNMPQVKVRKAGDKLVISGDVSDKDKAYITAIKGSYPELVDLTLSASSNPMVYMKVQITELGNKVSENLGIKWDINSGSSAINFTTLSNARNSVTGALTGQINATISAAIANGSALLLASPTLSALSGSEADFFAGGSFPIKTVSNDGTNIEFKDYGLSLKIAPVVESNGMISASIETELSDIDRSVAVDGTPGILSRKTSTKVSLKPNQTFAISGLVNQKASKDLSRFPLLSKVPIFGALFKSKNFVNNKSNLVIFITPYIAKPEGKINQDHLAKAEDIQIEYFDSGKFTLEIVE
jgi:pilus assembly protein CpaC